MRPILLLLTLCTACAGTDTDTDTTDTAPVELPELVQPLTPIACVPTMPVAPCGANVVLYVAPVPPGGLEQVEAAATALAPPDGDLDGDGVPDVGEIRVQCQADLGCLAYLAQTCLENRGD